MANSFQISNVIPRLFNGSKYETDSRSTTQKVKGNSYNPFANSNLKVDVLTADVFETTSFTGAEKTPSISKIKRMASAFVGSLGEAFPTFRQGIENIAAFCGRIMNGINGAWHFLSETKVPGIIDAGRAIKARWEEANYAKEVNMYAAKPVNELKDLLIESMSIAA